MKTGFTLIISTCILMCCNRPVIEIPLEELTFSQIHEGYKSGFFSAEELVNAYIKRIKENDHLTQAITYIHPDAISRAKELDQLYENTGKLLPLHGIPLIIKDNINTVGVPTTAGSKSLLHYYPEHDATVIRKLADAGAIILAKTNMAEWAFSPMHSHSTTSGTTRNPYDTAFVPAGSSGGTGAGVAFNFGAGGLGTDTGNSIRGPASHNALVGIRPTMGLVSREGIVPLYLRNDVVGPMCRTVEDAAKLLQIMTGVDPKDSLTYYSQFKNEVSYEEALKKDGLKGARIGVLRTLSKENIDSQVLQLFETAINDLEKEGAIMVDPFEVPLFDSLRRNQWCSMFREDIEGFLKNYVKNDTISTIADIDRIGSDSEYTRNRVRYFMESNGRRGAFPEECGDAYTDPLRVAFRNAIETAMDSLQLDAIIYPTWNFPPAHINLFEEEYRGDNNQIIAPHTGQPAITVPMGYVNGKLPSGIQFLGRLYSESTLIRLAFAYEQITLHRKKP